MSQTLNKVRTLVATGDVRISSHGYDELAEDGILVRDLIEGIEAASVVEDYRPSERANIQNWYKKASLSRRSRST